MTVLLLFVLLAGCTQGPRDYPTASFVLSDQLSHPDVSCFQMDRQGRMWIGTERGLNRYNGYDFHQYLSDGTPGSLPDDRIYSLCRDSLGRLWAGTENGVFLRTEEDGFVRVPVESEEKAVHQIVCDPEGRVILNLLEDLCVYDSLSHSFVNVVVGFDRYYSYHSVCHVGKDDRLWVVAPLEIRCFLPGEGFSNLDNFPTEHFVTLSALLSDGQIWMSGRHELSIFDTQEQEFLPVPRAVTAALGGQEVRMIEELAEDIVFFKTADTRMYLYRRSTGEMQPVGPEFFDLPEGFDINCIYRDAAGDLWLGSDDKGFHHYPFFRDALLSRMPARQLLKGQSVPSMSLDPSGVLWLFTRHDGLYRYDVSSGDLTHPEMTGISIADHTDILQQNLPLVYAAGNGDLWLAFPDQQHLLRARYTGGRIEVRKDYPAFYPRVATEDPDGGVWVGTRNEFLVHVDPKTGALERIQIWPYKTTFMHCLLTVGEKILVGSYDEPLALMDLRTRIVHQLDMAPDDMRRCIGNDWFNPTAFLRDDAGDIWIGTRAHGVLRYDWDQKTLSPVPGASTEDVASLLMDDNGGVWVSSRSGLARYDRDAGAFRDYLPQRGGTGHYYTQSAAVLPDGTLAFGSADGVTLVNPSDSAVRAAVPLVFEDLKVHDRETAPGGGIALRHQDNSFGVSFAAPDFRHLGRIRYSYRLDGYDQDWVDLGSSREVYLSNVPAGKYQLRVRYFLQPEQDRFVESSLPVRIYPSPWLSGWAIAGYLLLSAALLLLVWRIRRRFLRERAAAESAAREKEQERRINRMNMTFFSNISHEFRTPLTMISGPVSELSRSNRLQPEDSRLLNIVQHSVNRMLSLVNQLMDINKLENDSLCLCVGKADVVPVLKGCLELFGVNVKAMGLNLEDKGLESPLVTWFDEDKLLKIVGNLLSNAVKFTPRGGTVTLEADEIRQDGAPWLSITVSDTGPGIPEDQLERVFDRYYQLDNRREGGVQSGTGIGLFFARSLAGIHHGTLTASNRQPGPGAEFRLLLPMDGSAYPESERYRKELPVNGDYPLETVPEVMDTTQDREEADNRPLLLAVDDDPDILRYLETLFSGSYRMICAYGADEALQMAMDRAPDLVLSDVAMPGRDGFALCRDLKSNLQLSHIPVILVTAMGQVQSQVQGLDEGADAYVTKPFDPAYLKALVKSQLENRLRLQRLLDTATQTSEVDTLSSRDRSFLDELYGLMEKELGNEDLDIAHLTEMLRISRTKLYYKVKGLTGKPPSEFFMQYKLNVAARMLKEGKYNVSEVAIRTGFSTLPHFSKAFKRQFGVSPSRYGA